MAERSTEPGTVSRTAPRLAFLAATVVFAGFFVNTFLYVLTNGPTTARITIALLCLSALMFLQLKVFSNPRSELHSPVAYSALAVQAALIWVPVAYFGEDWIGLPGFLAGSAALVLPRLAGWLVFAANALVIGALQAHYTGPLIDILYMVMVTTSTGLIVYGLSRLRSLVAELDCARSELAKLAVTQERLRFARDLHDLLGFSLSAITLKIELTRRLVATSTERAREELTEVLAVARQALTDVRAVASSYRQLSLDDEIASARSVLSAAGVDVTLDAQPGELPSPISTVLATVLREGVTNILRHSRAERCAITLTREAGSVSIEIVNDGRPAATGEPSGNGIDNLTTRVGALGGELDAGPVNAQTFRLRATVPITAEPVGEDDAEHHDRRPSMAPRLALLLVSAVFVVYFINGVLWTLDAHLGPGATALTVTCLVGSLALQLGCFSNPRFRLRSPAGYAALAALATFTFLPIVTFERPTLGIYGFVAGSALLVLRPPVSWAVSSAVLLSVCGLQWAYGGGWFGVGYGIVATMNGALVVYGMSRLRSMVQELHDARSELAELAVTQERLRFARDLHDLLGYSLSAITLKTELAGQLVLRDPARATDELGEVLVICRQALADVRSVARSYRELSLDEEAQSAEALLRAADIDVTMRLDSCELPQEVRTTLATVLREGVTNLLRHSKAERCEITLTHSTGTVTMDIVNDGVPTSGRHDLSGSGIDNLTSRVRALGGILRACGEADTYRLHAEIPVG
ncbi:sensor histidine kinase [Lentzea nigeriaca]|uniref:sensor histidine kinase n=1 Tax=Lentzea nigeriaca TaxID=1128665 RepID=UPI00195EB670|nr:histidine kinase [Lentzea nigeriaca]MBM7862166.1 signal transduction histidine kinase [Lentzea nigeriaca]